MNRKYWCIAHVLVLFIIYGCATKTITESTTSHNTITTDSLAKKSFGLDVEFVKKYQQVVILHDQEKKRQVLLCPEYQGRVLTSTAQGLTGRSFGWLNYERIASKEVTPHLQSYGGEDRFWIGPQGGQFTVFFNPGDPFDFDHWFTPEPFDTEPFELTHQSDTSVRFEKKMHLTNYSKSSFDLQVNRAVRLMGEYEIKKIIGNTMNEVEFVAFESINEIVNTGSKEWKKETGLLSIWILGMFPPTPSTTVMIPYKTEASPLNITEYFVNILGKLPQDRLHTKDGVIYYKADGNHCSKIGIAQEHAKEFFGSYDQDNNILTIIQYSLPEQPSAYVNSLWEIQKEPYNGDVVNSYNDGTVDHTPAPSATFYELESSSPAKELKPGESIKHTHRTFHFVGEKEKLSTISKNLLGVTL